MVLRLHAGQELSLAPMAGAEPPIRFRPAGAGTWTARSGYQAGETLRVVTRPDGHREPPGREHVRADPRAVRCLGADPGRRGPRRLASRDLTIPARTNVLLIGVSGVQVSLVWPGRPTLVFATVRCTRP